MLILLVVLLICVIVYILFSKRESTYDGSLNCEFIENLSTEEYDDFVYHTPSTSFMQTSSWGCVKEAWQSEFVGLKVDGKLACAAMILRRRFFKGIELFYVPRGFVIDYANEELLRAFVFYLKQFAKKRHAFAIKIDPYLCLKEENVHTFKNTKNVEIRKSFSDKTDTFIKNIERVGFQHGGLRKEVNAYIQPRFTMVIPLKDLEGKRYTEEELRRTFPRNVRNYIGKYHEDRGVVFSYSKDKSRIKELVEVLDLTASRQGVALRKQEYFEMMMNQFENAVLFFAHVDVLKYKEFLEKNKEKTKNYDVRMQEVLDIQKKYGNYVLAGATIVLMPVCEEGVKVASFLYAGTNTEVFPSLKITNGLMFYRLCYCMNEGCDYCDLGGVDGSLEDHLSVFKSKFNPTVLEFVGEYDLVLNRFLFFMFTKGIKFYKKIIGFVLKSS